MALSFFLSGWAGRDIRQDDSAEQLFSRYRSSRNTDYLAKLMVLHGNDLYHFLLRQSDQLLAEDISQQCWLKLLEQPDSYRGLSQFKTWLFSVARNCLIDELRKQQRWQPGADPELLLLQSPGIEQQLIQSQQQLMLSKQLSLLPFFQREALMLQLEGFSMADICDITQQHEETIKSRLRYAKSFLQRVAGGQDVKA